MLHTIDLTHRDLQKYIHDYNVLKHDLSDPNILWNIQTCQVLIKNKINELQRAIRACTREIETPNPTFRKLAIICAIFATFDILQPSESYMDFIRPQLEKNSTILLLRLYNDNILGGSKHPADKEYMLSSIQTLHQSFVLCIKYSDIEYRQNYKNFLVHLEVFMNSCRNKTKKEFPNVVIHYSPRDSDPLV